MVEYTLKPEDQARQTIDKMLIDSGWIVQPYKKMNRTADIGVAVAYFPLANGLEADYVLFVEGKAVGVIEAKAEGVTLSGVAEQSEQYLNNFPQKIPLFTKDLPIHYESTGVETYFRDKRDPDARSRRVFSFHKPEEIRRMLLQADTLRCRLNKLPILEKATLWDVQYRAITSLEKSLSRNRPRALIQMATGAGKTFTMVTEVYRLIQYAKAKRILFLVDRGNLGEQAYKEFSQYTTPDDGRKFTEIYNVQHMKSNVLDKESKVCITTIQRLYSMLSGEKEFDESLEEESLDKFNAPKEVRYQPALPIETFDFIITDECHRSIYNLWRQVLEYFDAFLIGLTATPSKQTIGFFNKNLVMEYSHEQAVADGVNVGYEVYRIETKITKDGTKVDAGNIVDKRERLTRKLRWEQLDEDLEVKAKELDRSVVVKDQIRTVIGTFRDKLFSEIFPGRSVVPKTLIFAKDDSHAEDIVDIVREEFGKGNDFCKKITYRTTGEAPKDLIKQFRNSRDPRIAVTVDMIATGTDIKPIECLLFMRDVRSRGLFDQMKGRGTRVIDKDDLLAVTEDAKQGKSYFVIVDAVGVCESVKTDTQSLERKKSVSIETLMLEAAKGNHEEDILTTLAGRMARLALVVEKADISRIQDLSDGKDLNTIAGELLHAADPDAIIEKAQVMFTTSEPTKNQQVKAAAELAEEASAPFNKPDFRDLILEIKKKSEQTIDTISQDEVLDASFSEQTKEAAKGTIQSFKQFIEDNKDELTALQMIYNKPYSRRHFIYAEIKQLAESIQKPPYHLTVDKVWYAYRQLERSRVKGASPQRLLTDIISLVRFATGADHELMGFNEAVNARFEKWTSEQVQKGRIFSQQQKEWLVAIKDHIAANAEISRDDFEYTPFVEHGGLQGFYKQFGTEMDKVLDELNATLIA